MNIPFVKSKSHIIGVYFLFDCGKLVYVGQSTNVLKRIGDHIKSVKVFDSHAVIECLEETLLDLESAYIMEYKPYYNVMSNNSSGLPPSISPTQAKRIIKSKHTDKYCATYYGVSEAIIARIRA